MIVKLKLRMREFMKTRLKLLLLLVIIVGTFTFANSPFLLTVRATYVEGLITQDTVWTLVDSPLVLSGNVTVLDNATLTVEPEVEVRFGGSFFLIVEGRLIANGTQEKMIRFTSNKEKPEAGDWGTIRFNGIESTLEYCVIEYGTNSITLENGTLNILRSIISLNSENGITIVNGSVTIEHNTVANNTASGIHISGCNKTTIQNNIIASNNDGITLAGNLTSSEITIKQNSISLNGWSGIFLEAFGNTDIRNNTLSMNRYGFYVSTNTSTLITRNYILNNTVGIFYEKGIEHKANFNNICENGLGMDVSPNAAVNATYNFWADKSGPYHASLNPYGKGDPVGGDGVNLDFIFFLTASIDYHNNPPRAVLWADKTLVAPNQEVTFVGSDSYDEGRVDKYFFDFGDGSYSSWTTLSLFFHKYALAGNYTASLKVMDDFGNVSDFASTLIHVVNWQPLEVTLTLSNHTIGYNEEVSVIAHVSFSGNPVENANLTPFSVKGGSFMPQSGLTNSTGYFVATFKAPNVTEVTNIRIIARASMDGFADGSDYIYLKVLPPLTVNVTAEPQRVLSEETATITVYVTDAFGRPVENASLKLVANYGSLSIDAVLTNQSGMATSEFTAPMTLTNITATIAVVATKDWYAEGYGECTVTIEPKKLVVDAHAEPSIILSEATSMASVYVSCEGVPVPDVSVTLSSSKGGNFSEVEKITDMNGIATFTFTAPITTANLTTTIVATATKYGYVSGEGQANITVIPRVLIVRVIAYPDSINSEMTSNVTVQVTYDSNPISDVTVTLSSDNGGSFYPINGTTDANGECLFTFTSPQVTTPINITITATATKTGYADGTNRTTITVNPGTLDVQVTANPATVEPEATSTVTVHVTYNGKPVANAVVTISGENGTFSVTTGITDENGYCTFAFTAPQTKTQLNVTITATATKSGYIDGQGQTKITVSPVFPLTTILMIAAVIVVIAIVLVLIKLKIIVVTWKEG